MIWFWYVCWYAKLALLHAIPYHTRQIQVGGANLKGAATHGKHLYKKRCMVPPLSLQTSLHLPQTNLRSRWVDLHESKQSRSWSPLAKQDLLIESTVYDVRNSPKVTWYSMCSVVSWWATSWTHEAPACRQLDLLLSPRQTWLFSCWLRTQAQCSG